MERPGIRWRRTSSRTKRSTAAIELSPCAAAGTAYVADPASAASRSPRAARTYFSARRGRRTSSPPQLGQRCPISIVQVGQKVHS